MLRFFLYSNIHIPFLAVGLLGGTSLLLGIPFSIPLALVSGAGAFLVYQVDRIWVYSPEDLINQPRRVDWYQTHRLYNIASSVIAVIIGVTAFFSLHPLTAVTCVFLGCTGVAYLIPYGRRKWRVKDTGIVKSLLIAFCWSVGGVILPVVEGQVRMNSMVWIFFFYRFCLIVSNALLADLPDLKGDSNTKVNFNAVVLSRLGVVNSSVSFAVLSLVFGVIHSWQFGWVLWHVVDLGGAIVMVGFAINAYSTRATASHVMYGFVIDLVVAWPFISIALSHFLVE